GLTLAAGFHTGRLGKDIQGATPPQHTANRFDALVAYANPDVRVGAEYFSATDWNNVLTATSDKAAGYSLWASYNFSPMWGVFGRGDWAKPNKDTAPDLKDRYFNVGLVTHVRKNIDIAFAYKNERVDGGTAGTHSIGTSNGTIGGLSEGTYHEVGVWAQVVF
ncbi:MAG: porin, partial [Steroidobacteraceae bacterium]